MLQDFLIFAIPRTAHHFSVYPDQGERRLQLMGGVRHERLLPFEGAAHRPHRPSRHEKPTDGGEADRQKTQGHQPNDEVVHGLLDELVRLRHLDHADHFP